MVRYSGLWLGEAAASARMVFAAANAGGGERAEQLRGWVRMIEAWYVACYIGAEDGALVPMPVM